MNYVKGITGTTNDGIWVALILENVGKYSNVSIKAFGKTRAEVVQFRDKILKGLRHVDDDGNTG